MSCGGPCLEFKIFRPPERTQVRWAGVRIEARTAALSDTVISRTATHRRQSRHIQQLLGHARIERAEINTHVDVSDLAGDERGQVCTSVLLNQDFCDGTPVRSRPSLLRLTVERLADDRLLDSVEARGDSGWLTTGRPLAGRHEPARRLEGAHRRRRRGVDSRADGSQTITFHSREFPSRPREPDPDRAPLIVSCRALFRSSARCAA